VLRLIEKSGLLRGDLFLVEGESAVENLSIAISVASAAIAAPATAPATTAAVSSAAASATVSAAAATAAFARLRACFIHHERAPQKFLAVERGDCFFRFGIVTNFSEAETARLACKTVAKKRQ
jgi:hypothetical protein